MQRYDANYYLHNKLVTEEIVLKYKVIQCVQLNLSFVTYRLLSKCLMTFVNSGKHLFAMPRTYSTKDCAVKSVEKVHYIILSCGQHYVNEMMKKKEI